MTGAGEEESRRSSRGWSPGEVKGDGASPAQGTGIHARRSHRRRVEAAFLGSAPLSPRRQAAAGRRQRQP